MSPTPDLYATPRINILGLEIDESLAYAYHIEKQLDTRIVRFFNTVGPRQLGAYGLVVPRFVK